MSLSPLFSRIQLSQWKRSVDGIAILLFMPQLALTEPLPIILPIDSLYHLPRSSAAVIANVILFPQLFQHDYPHAFAQTHPLSSSPPPTVSARCCKGYRAAGEAAGVRWRARSQAPVSEEGPSEWVLHGYQRGESPFRQGTAGPWTPMRLMSLVSVSSVRLLSLFGWPFSCYISLLWCYFSFLFPLPLQSNSVVAAVMLLVGCGEGVAALSPGQSWLALQSKVAFSCEEMISLGRNNSSLSDH